MVLRRQRNKDQTTANSPVLPKFSEAGGTKAEKREAVDVRMKTGGTECRRGVSLKLKEEHDDLLNEGPETEERPTCAAWFYPN